MQHPPITVETLIAAFRAGGLPGYAEQLTEYAKVNSHYYGRLEQVVEFLNDGDEAGE